MARYLLTDKTIQKGAKDGLRRLSDGDGLYILFSVKGGSHGWRMDYSLDGRRKTLSLGTYPDTSLALARQKADEFRQLIAQGLDPSDVRKTERQKTLKTLEAERRQEQGLPADGSFEHVAREWHQTVHIAKVSPGHAERTLTRLTQDVFPWLGSMPIAAISAPKLLETLRRVEKRGAIETAHRIRQACGQIFRYGIAIGACERDPAHDLRDALSPVVVQHHAAITDPQKLGGLLRSFHDYTGLPVTCAALKLAPLVFLRPGELRQAEWAEFDLDAGLWTIPASRMKRLKQQKISGAPHVVPLATQAVAILDELRPLTGRGRYVFPSPRTPERPMSENGVLSAMRRMGFGKDEMTGHGFRATARTLLVERLGEKEAVVEAQLAHSVRDTLGRAYNRTEFLEQRKAMMQKWADYLDQLRRNDPHGQADATPST